MSLENRRSAWGIEMGKHARLFFSTIFLLVQLFGFSSFGKPLSNKEKVELFNQIFKNMVLTSEKKTDLWERIWQGKALTLEERIASEVGKKTKDFPAELRLILAQKHVILVDGIMNELARLARNYFSDNIAQLNQLGITSTHCRYSSRISIPKNADDLYQDILTIFAKRKKPIILMGHSMGGGESLYVVLKHPELLMNGIIEKVVLIEAAIGGSDLVENVSDGILGSTLKKFLGEGFHSLLPEISQKNFREIYATFQATLKGQFAALDGAGGANLTHLNEAQDKIDELSKRVFYVRSAHRPNSRKLSIGLDIVMFFFNNESMKAFDNDGLMPVDNQILGLLPHFGVDLGIIEADHIELVISGFS